MKFEFIVSHNHISSQIAVNMFGDIDIYPKLVGVDFFKFLMTLVGKVYHLERIDGGSLPNWFIMAPSYSPPFGSGDRHIGLQSVPTTGIRTSLFPAPKTTRNRGATCSS